MEYKDKSEEQLIDEIKQLKQKLLEKEYFISSLPTTGFKLNQNFDLLLQSTNVGMFDWNLQTNELIISERWAEIVGYTMEDLMPINVETWHNLIHSDDLIRSNFILEKHLMGKLEFFDCESRMKHKNGQWVWVHSKGKIIELDIEGKPLRMIGIHYDITDRKKTERELIQKNKALLDAQRAAHVGNWSHDLLNDKMQWSEEFFRICQIDVQRPTKKLLISIIHKEDLGILLDAMKDAANGNRHQKHVFRIVRPDGSIRYVYNRWVSYYDEHGEEVRRLGTHQDITELKFVEKELLVAKEKAEAANRLKSEFLAQISHEIRTPINTMLNYSQLVNEEFGKHLGADQDEYFGPIKSAGERIIRTVDLILNMSELQTGSYEPIFQEVDLYNKIVKKVFAEQKQIAYRKGLKISIENNVGSCLKKLDLYSTEQIFSNIISNAIQYSNEGQISIKLYKNDKDLVTVDISDTGIGIAKEYMDYLFEPFSQEEQGYTRKHEGNGLGLALVREYCKINNVDIQVRSEKGVGSTFTVLFN